MHLNTGKFEVNGRCGYVRKPEVMTAEGTKYNPFTTNDLDNVVPLSLTLKVLSAQHLGVKGVRPYVAIKTFGLHEVEAWKTPPSKTANAVSHRWSASNVRIIDRVVLPSMTQVYFTVHDQKDDSLLGYVALPVDSLRTGFRHIPLLAARSSLASIFVHVAVKTVEPQQHIDFVDNLMNPVVHQKKERKRKGKRKKEKGKGEEERERGRGEGGKNNNTARAFVVLFVWCHKH